jgi:hypothetical protein
MSTSQTTERAPSGETERAEALIEGATERASGLVDRVGDLISRMATRAREEAADLWAEARSVEQGTRRPT